MPKKTISPNALELQKFLSRREFFQITGSVAAGIMVSGSPFVFGKAMAQPLQQGSGDPQGLGTEQPHTQQGGVAMPFNLYLRIDGIDGESTADKHKNEIDVESFSWGGAQAGSSVAPGREKAAGKVSMQGFRVVMPLSKASPKLMLASVQGDRIREAVLTCESASGKGQEEFLKIKLGDVTIASYETAGDSDHVGPRPLDQVTLNFGKITFEYSEVRPDGSKGASTKAGWDVTANKAI